MFQPDDDNEHAAAVLRHQFSQIRSTRIAAGCDIVDMKACLNLHEPIFEAELHGIFKIPVPPEETHLKWRCSVTFNKCKDLCESPEDDLPVIDYHVAMKPLDDKVPGVCGHLMRVYFPAIAWAHALSKLAAIS